MTIGWSLLTLVGLALGVLVARVLMRLVADRRHAARPPKKLRDSDRDPTVAHLGHS